MEKYRAEIRALSPEERRARFGKTPRKSIARKTYLPRATKPIPQRNEKRIARKAVAYRKVIASDFHKKIRYQAFFRSGGLCECSVCVKARVSLLTASEMTADQLLAWQRAITPIPVWFTRKGGEPWRRFRSDEGETHHTSYQLFGKENPAELELVEWQWDACHKRIEAEHGTRRRFLWGRKAA